MKKKKILICYDFMHMGGTERFILNLLYKLIEDGHDVYLHLQLQEGDYLKEIPSQVKFFNPYQWSEEEAQKKITSCFKKLAPRDRLRELDFAGLLSSLRIRKTKHEVGFYQKALFDYVKTEEFDIAICASMTSPYSLGIVAAVNAKVRYAWVHMPFHYGKRADYVPKYGVPFNASYSLPWLKKYDKIICVAKGIKKIFDFYVPSLSDRSEVVYNQIADQDIRTKSEDKNCDVLDRGEIKILSVGRFVPQKGFDLAVKSAKILKKQGHRFCWYIIGGGEQEAQIKHKIRKSKLENFVVLLGKKSNPYPYFKQCDIYCQPSRFEAYCMTVTEARILQKAVVATRATGMDEQINHGENGILTDISAKSIAQGLAVLFNTDRLEEIKSKVTFPNDEEANLKNKLDRLFV